MNENYANLYSGGQDNPETMTAENIPVNVLPEVPEIPKYEYHTSERVTAGILLLCGFLLVRFGAFHTSGLITTLIYWIIVTTMTIFFKKEKKEFLLGDKLGIAVLYIFSAVDTITANGFLKFLNFIFLLMAWNLILLRMASPHGVLKYLPYSVNKAVFAQPFAEFNKAFQAIFSGNKSGAFWKNVAYVAIGLVVAVPLTCMVASLLIEADDNVSNIVGNLIKIPPEELLEMIPQIAVGLLIGAGLFSSVWGSLHKSTILNQEECAKKVEGMRIVPNPILYAMVTPICVLYVIYIISQTSYFLGGFTGQTNGLTYAEYARKGFFELCWICCINFAVIAGMGLLARISGAVRPMMQKIYSTFLSGCSIFIAGTAIAKMAMYIHVYGMTQFRIYTTWFMILLVIGFVGLIIKQFANDFNLGKMACIAFTIMFGILCFSRPDAMIVRYNAEHYLSGQIQEFDTSVLRGTSDDAWAELSKYDNDTLYKLVGNSYQSEVRNHTFSDFYEMTNLSAWELLNNDWK